MSDPLLRRAGPGDSELAFAIRRAAFRGYVEMAGGWDEAEERRLHARRFAEQDCRIVSVGGTDVGFLAITQAEGVVKLNQLFILPGHQGTGIGWRCVCAVMDEARRRGLPVALRVLKVNPRARSFYERLGFVPTGETDTHTLMQWRP